MILTTRLQQWRMIHDYSKMMASVRKYIHQGLKRDTFQAVIKQFDNSFFRRKGSTFTSHWIKCSWHSFFMIYFQGQARQISQNFITKNIFSSEFLSSEIITEDKCPPNGLMQTVPVFSRMFTSVMGFFFLYLHLLESLIFKETWRRKINM